jgi:Putative adhesin
MRWTFGCSALLLLLAASPALTQTHYLETQDCDEWSGDRARHCEVREETLAGGNPLDVDATPNGGIRVRGWERTDVVLRARIVGYADTNEQARQLTSQVRIETGGGQIRARGPARGGEHHWSVSFELNVPQRSDLTLRTVNGGITIADLHGTVKFKATNGGVRLENVAGDVTGQTSNGGLNIDLNGNRWDGNGLDVATHNGGINLRIPSDYSAELEAGTTNGGLRVDFPITVQGAVNRHINTTLGAGGPKIRAVTHNGGINIRRR